MGQKRTWKRVDLLFCLAGCLIWLSGCLHTPAIWKTEEHLARAKHNLDKGDYENALKECRTALQLYPQSLGDQAYFMTGLVYAHPENPQRDPRKAIEAFETVVRRYPESHFKIQAEIWEKVLRKNQEAATMLQAHNREIRSLKNELRTLEENIGRLKAQQEAKLEEKDKQINELKRNIDQLKEIDLKIEEKKRKPAP